MSKAIRILLMVSLTTFAAGGLTYRFGSQVNLATPQAEGLSVLAGAPGDKWLYLGGLMILLAGALAVAAIKSLIQERRGNAICSLKPSSISE